MAKSYAIQFYNSKHWRNVRKEVLRRDMYTCCDCHSRASEVHHIIELTPSNIHDVSIALNPDNLRSLCHDCHDKVTKGQDGDIVGDYVFDDAGNVVPR
jgi:5-methylcytosine-specific restriction endonuclease McrA